MNSNSKGTSSMTYSEWSAEHSKKVAAIYGSLRDKSPEAVYQYFMYDNMRKNEPDFCPLYKSNTRCHNMKDLNCFQCACPHFKVVDNPAPDIQGYITESICTINSRFSAVFTTGNVKHCDCSKCDIPHTKASTLKALQSAKESTQDSSSFLEHLRSYQLWTIFGKFKLF